MKSIAGIAGKVGLSKEEFLRRICDYDSDTIKAVAIHRGLEYDEDLSIEKLRLMVIFDIEPMLDSYIPYGKHKFFKFVDKTYFMGSDYLWRYDEPCIDLQIVFEYDTIGVLYLFMGGKNILGTCKGKIQHYDVDFDYKTGLMYNENEDTFFQCVKGTERERAWLKTRMLLE